jgi:hypothetical protein
MSDLITELTEEQRYLLCEIIFKIYMEGYQCGIVDEEKFIDEYLTEIEKVIRHESDE